MSYQIGLIIGSVDCWVSRIGEQLIDRIHWLIDLADAPLLNNANGDRQRGQSDRTAVVPVDASGWL